MLGVVDEYCMKAMRATHTAPVEAVQLLEELDSDYEVEVAAFSAPRLYHNTGRGGIAIHQSQKTWCRAG